MLEGILSVSGKPGLYKMLSREGAGASKSYVIAESLLDGSRTPVYTTQKVSALRDIAMYSAEGDVRLSRVMANLYTALGGQPAPLATASKAELEGAMDKALPTWDRERVRTSDIKKLVTWYNLLLSKGLVSGDAGPDEGEEGEPTKPEASSTPAPAAPQKAQKGGQVKGGPVKAAPARTGHSSKG